MSSRLLNFSFFLLTFLAASLNAGAASGATSQPTQSSAIAEIIQKAMKTEHLRSVIVKVTQGDKVIISQAFGESMTGRAGDHSDALPQRRRRLRLPGDAAHAIRGRSQGQARRHDRALDAEVAGGEQGHVKDVGEPDLGLSDYETDPKFLAAFDADPFHIFTFEERLKIAFSRPMMFDPGTNWSYAHTNFMILGGDSEQDRRETVGRTFAAKKSWSPWD